LGYQPETYYCLICQKNLYPGRLYFSLQEGGIVCKACAQKLKIKELIEVSEDFVKVLRIILKGDWQTLKRLRIGEPAREMMGNVSEKYLFFISEENK
jgi:recombinational DNA repair protein (RecF pathway)